MVFASAGAEFGSSRGPGVQLSAQYPGQPHPVKDSTHSTNSGAPPPTEKLANPDSLSSPTHPPHPVPKQTCSTQKTQFQNDSYCTIWIV